MGKGSETGEDSIFASRFMQSCSIASLAGTRQYIVTPLNCNVALNSVHYYKFIPQRNVVNFFKLPNNRSI